VSVITPSLIIGCVVTVIVGICYLCRRDWKVVASRDEQWGAYHKGSRVGDAFVRTLVLERCTITGKEQAYYYDSDGVEWVRVGAAKAALGIKDTPPSP
jgi:hypothetical protein